MTHQFALQVERFVQVEEGFIHAFAHGLVVSIHFGDGQQIEQQAILCGVEVGCRLGDTRLQESVFCTIVRLLHQRHVLLAKFS